VEWDDSAIEFLLARGFTADLGARPLKRAIDRYLLSPLAMAIVGHEVPEGDQFLYISSDGQDIVVEFVDPHAPAEPDGAIAEPSETEEEVALASLMLKPRGAEAEAAALRGAFGSLEQRIAGEGWRKRKARDLEEMGATGFWESDERFAVLGAVEYMDRMESGLATARSLISRLRDSGGDGRYSGSLVSRLALQVYLLQEALAALEEGLPKDAFLRIEGGVDSVEKTGFSVRLRDMYIGWARRRHMRFKILLDRLGQSPGHCVLAVSGFGAFRILQGEAGLHVLESPQRERWLGRHPVTVRVAAQPDTPALGDRDLVEQAENAFGSTESGRSVVRSYRENPSPLVRDHARGWRTGRLETVLAGNFDLFGRTLRS
jgi:ATP-dependent Clp protease ATP-binding subunit ClpC